MSNSQKKTLQDYIRLHQRNAATHAIRAAVDLGIIGALAEGQKTVGQLAESLELDPSALHLMMNVLCQTELVENYQDDYALSTVARLIPPEFWDFGDQYWRHLGRFVRSGVSLANDQHMAFTNEDYLSSVAVREWMWTPAALDAAEVLQIGRERRGLRILDVGCGSAVFSATLAHRDPETRVVLLDHSAGLQRAQATVDSVGLESQSQFVEADYLDFELSGELFDLIIVPGLVHRHGINECEQLFHRLYRLGKAESEIAVIDVFPGQEKGDSYRAVIELELCLRTTQGGLHLPTQLQAALNRAGFQKVQYAHLPSEPHIWGLILATRV
jgi:2-polyprenyl-3-methyl-5-hydroxy-6-metoxy-1,4-benzoquinol methylase